MWFLFIYSFHKNAVFLYPQFKHCMEAHTQNISNTYTWLLLSPWFCWIQLDSLWWKFTSTTLFRKKASRKSMVSDEHCCMCWRVSLPIPLFSWQPLVWQEILFSQAMCPAYWMTYWLYWVSCYIFYELVHQFIPVRAVKNLHALPRHSKLSS